MIQTIYTATIWGENVRFFPPQTVDELMPWVAVDELMRAMRLTPAQQSVSGSIARQWPNHTKRIGPSKGFTNIISFSSAKELVQASADMGYVPAAFEDDFVASLFDAARQIHPEMFDQTDDGEWVVNMNGLVLLMSIDEDHLADFLEEHRDEFQMDDNMLRPRAR
jgi:hypothetical protein